MINSWFHYYAGDPTMTSIRGMDLQMELMRIHSDNLAFADIPGYQKKEPVVSSFATVLGKKAVEEVKNTEVGRLLMTQRPLDVALSTPGYFQKMHPDGHIELTRDGRFKLDKMGQLQSIEGYPVLSELGLPIRFSPVPQDLKAIKINPSGHIRVLDAETQQFKTVGRIGVIKERGKLADNVEMRQGNVEASNVFTFEVAADLAPTRRAFQANRQMFITQNQLMTRLIQELGRTQ